MNAFSIGWWHGAAWCFLNQGGWYREIIIIIKIILKSYVNQKLLAGYQWLDFLIGLYYVPSTRISFRLYDISVSFEHCINWCFSSNIFWTSTRTTTFHLKCNLNFLFYSLIAIYFNTCLLSWTAMFDLLTQKQSNSTTQQPWPEINAFSFMMSGACGELMVPKH